MKKFRIKTDVSIGTIFQKIQCVDEANTLLQNKIETLREHRDTCCGDGYTVDGEPITIDGETLI